MSINSIRNLNIEKVTPPTPTDNKFYIYNKGQILVPISDKGYTWSTDAGWTLDDASFESDRIITECTKPYGLKSCAIITENTIDLTDYKAIHFVIRGTLADVYSMYYGITQSKSNIDASAHTITSVTSAFMDYTLDISTVSGNYYVWAGTCYDRAGEISEIWLEPKDYLYKDGVQKVEWDNSGIYKSSSTYTSDGGFILDSSSMNCPAITVSNTHNREIITNDVVDLSNYKTINIVYNGSNQLSLNVASVTSSAYIVIWSDFGTTGHLYITATPTKDLYSQNKYAEIKISNLTYPIFINRIWLE